MILIPLLIAIAYVSFWLSIAVAVIVIIVAAKEYYKWKL